MSVVGGRSNDQGAGVQDPSIPDAGEDARSGGASIPEDKASKLDPSLLAALQQHVKSSGIDQEKLDRLLEALENASPAVQELLGQLGAKGIATLMQALNAGGSAVQELLSSLEHFAGSDAGRAGEYLSHASDLMIVMAGGTVSPPERQDAMEQYASAPSPLNALQADMANLQVLNEGFNGAGEFTLDDLTKLGLSSVNGGDSGARVAEAVASLKALEQSSEFASVQDIMRFVAKYEAAGGTDPAALLSQMPEVDAGINNIKESLGMAPSDLLLGSKYENYLKEILAKGAAEGNIDGAVLAEKEKIATTFKDQEVPLSQEASMAYQNGGFAETDVPIELGGPKAEDNEFSGPHPGSGENTGSSSETTDVVFPPLTEYGISDISESPLYNEAELQTQFKGDTKAYGEYLAQAHFLLEDPELGLGFKPEDYDGEGDDPLTQPEIKNYLANVGYDKETIAEEALYIRDAKAHFQGLADEKGVEGSQNPDVKSFNSVDYVRTGGNSIEFDVPPGLERPEGQFLSTEVYPKFVIHGLKGSFSAHSATVETTAVALDFNQREQDAHSKMTGVLTKGATSDPSADAQLDQADRDAFKTAEDDRLRYGLMQEFISENHKNEDKDQPGNPKYYDSDGELTMKYDQTGKPVLNDKGQPMSELEFDAITTYADDEMLEQLIPPPAEGVYEGVEIQAGNMDVAQLKKELKSKPGRGALDTEFNIDNVKTVADLRVQEFEREGESVARKGKTLTQELEKANSKLEKFTDYSKRLLELYSQDYDDNLRLLKTTLTVVA